VESTTMKRIPAPSVGFLMLVTLISTPLGAGCAKPELQSRWRDREVTVDGAIGVPGQPDREWAGSRFALEDEGVSVGLLNDGEFLYLSLETRDRGAGMQMLHRGFTVWFDPDGGDDKALGVEFPLAGRQPGAGMGIPGMEMPGMEMLGPGKMPEGETPDRAGKEPDLAEMDKRIGEAIAAMDEFVIYGPGKGDVHPRVMGEGKGVDVRVGVTGGAFVYELKVPLARTSEHPYGIGVEPGRSIGVGFVTPEMDKTAMKGGMRMEGGGGGMGGGPPSGGFGGGPPGGGGRSGGPMGGGMPGMQEPLDAWIKVTLATADAALTGNGEKGQR
jgi:hypothetical protein